MPKRAISKNFSKIVASYLDPMIRGVILEGGSRSRKTWSIIDFILWLCKEETVPFTFNIVKETYSNFKTTLHNDFNERLPQMGQLSPFETVREVPSFHLFRNKFSLIGADQPSKFEGAGTDFIWFNEALPIQKVIFDNAEQRCKRFWIMDFNPRVSDHWIFNMAKRDDVRFIHSTMLDNPFVPYWQKKKIKGYEPNKENIALGTADDYMWKVYGLGLRASPTGLVYHSILWVDDIPDDVEQVTYGMDFGSAAPTAIVKVARRSNDLFVKLMYYTPTQNAKELYEPLQKIIGDNHIWADSADRLEAGSGVIADLRRMGMQVMGVRKFPGSVNYGIGLVNGFKLHLVRDPDLRKEQENYKWREVNGIRLSEPVKGFDHAFDAMRYAVMSEFR